jgi:hypothetical protein
MGDDRTSGGSGHRRDLRGRRQMVEGRREGGGSTCTRGGQKRETQIQLLAHTRAHLIVQSAIKDCGALSSDSNVR